MKNSGLQDWVGSFWGKGPSVDFCSTSPKWLWPYGHLATEIRLFRSYITNQYHYQRELILGRDFKSIKIIPPNRTKSITTQLWRSQIWVDTDQCTQLNLEKLNLKPSRIWKVIPLVCLLLMGFILGGQAQTASLQGTILDQTDKLPLIGAHISLPELDRRTITDASGFFRLTELPTGEFLIEVSYTGKTTFREKVRIRNQNKDLVVKLEDEAQLLSEVSVQAEQEETFGLARLRAVEGVAIYEGKKSEVVVLGDLAANLAANNPRQVYGRVAGLNIWESDGAGLQLGIGGRGLSPNRTANFNTRQNGYDISADALGYPESYYTPPTEALDRIQVVRGAASLQYGTQFGGMLNFVFKKPPADRKISVVSRQTLGSFGFLGTYNQLAGTLGKGKFSYFTYYQYKQGDGWRPNSQFEMHNAFASLSWKPSDRWEIGLEVTRMNYLAQQAGGLTDALFERDARASYRERNWFKVDWNLLALTLDYRLSDRTRINIRNFGLLASRKSLGVLSPINVTDFGENRDLIEGGFENMGNETRLLHRYSMGGQEHTFVAGIRLYKGYTTARQGDGNDGSGPDFYFLDPENVGKSDYAFPNTNYAAFAEHIFRLGEKWSLTPGVRYEYIHTQAEGYYNQRVYDAAGNLVTETREEETESRKRDFLLFGLGASWKPSDRYEFYANLSQNYRAINFSDLRIDNPNSRIDPNITDERGFTADLGWRTRSGGWLYADLTAFYVSYRDRIGQVLRSGEPPLYNDYRLRTNIADARNLGLEIFAEADLWHFIRNEDPNNKLSLFVNTSFIDARYINTDDLSILNRKVELVPPITVRTGLSYRHRDLRASFIWAYTAEHFTDATNARRTSSAVNGIIPAYQVADLSLGYKWRFLSLEASCNNLFDARYFTRRAEAYPGPGIIPAEGRSFFVTIGVSI